jgi:hypothetical protein
MTNKTESSEDYRNPDGTFAKGNPGRPKGTLNFATKFRKFVEKVAEQNEMKPEEVDEQLLMIGFNRAKSGDYQFWRDIHDRVYGKPLMSIEHTEIDAREQRVPTAAEKRAARAYYLELEKDDKRSNSNRTNNLAKGRKDKK